MEEKRKILIVDADAGFTSGLAERFRLRGADVRVATTAEEAMGALRESPTTDVVLMDAGLGESGGVDLIGEVRAFDPNIPMIILTGSAGFESAVDAIRRGACDYAVKSIGFDPLWLRVENAVRSCRAFRSLARMEREISKPYSFDRFIHESELMDVTIDHLKQLATSDATVLITGESGVGKELAARMLHFNGHRARGPFVAVSCAAMPESLIENELFGHEKGSFTDAHGRQPGKFELADGGTIFLDELGELPPAVQTKLLRVLQEKSFHRIGGVKEISVDVRVITATNRDLSAAVQRGEFRADLFYRVSVLPIIVPPLRERREDIAPLAVHFMREFSRKMGRPFAGFSGDALDMMRSYSWPGNVRELQNAVERAVVFGRPPLLKAGDIALGPSGRATRVGRESADEIQSLRDVESHHIANALAYYRWNISKAAQRLGIGRDTLYRKIRQYGLKKK